MRPFSAPTSVRNGVDTRSLGCHPGPMYPLFIEGKETAGRQNLASKDNQERASRGRGQRRFYKFRNALTRMSQKDRAVPFLAATKLIGTKRPYSY